MACMMFLSQGRTVNDYLTTSEVLDLLPYTVEEAVQQFGESVNNLSFSFVEALQSALHDSVADFSLPHHSTETAVHNTSNDKSAICDSFCKISPEEADLSGKIQVSKKDSETTGPAFQNEKPRTTLCTSDVRVYDYESWPASSVSVHPLLEVSPGFVVRIRGYDETKQACCVAGESTTAKCASCKAALQCVHDAEFVLCQACRFISPVQQSRRDFCSPDEAEGFKLGGGLALGLVSSREIPSPCSRISSPCFSATSLKHRVVSAPHDSPMPQLKKVKYTD